MENLKQLKIKKLASKIIGDGKSPNKFFVTVGPYVSYRVDDYDRDFKLIDGYSAADTWTDGPFNSYEEALTVYHGYDLDETDGHGQIVIEDRLTGTVREKFLVEETVSQYTQDEIDDSRLLIQ